MSKKLPEYYIIRNNHKYRLDPESMLCLPVNVYWKDIEGLGLGCNDLNAEACSFRTRHDVVGIRAIDFLPPAPAKLITEVDRSVMNSGQEKSLVEYLVDAAGICSAWLSNKQPMFNQDGKVVGLFGTASPISYGVLSETRESVKRFGINIQDLMFHHSLQEPKIQAVLNSLSPRLSEYLYYLLQGMQDKVIAAHMNIRVRTAESYSNAIKLKLDCRTRDAVIAKVLNPFHHKNDGK